MNLDSANARLKKDLDTFEKLKSAFIKVNNAENVTREKRIAIFKTMYSIEEKDNEGLKNIYTTINEKMQNFEDIRKNHLDHLQKLIRITEFYPIDFKEQKRKLEDLAKNRKLLGPPPVTSGQKRPQYEIKSEKDFVEMYNKEKEKNNNIKNYLEQLNNKFITYSKKQIESNKIRNLITENSIKNFFKIYFGYEGAQILILGASNDSMKNIFY